MRSPKIPFSSQIEEKDEEEVRFLPIKTILLTHMQLKHFLTKFK